MEAAVDDTADGVALDVNITDALRLLDLPGRRSADEGDLDTLGGWDVLHVMTLGATRHTAHRSNCGLDA